MSKKFSKTRKISRKQRSKRNKKTRSNRKRGGEGSITSTNLENTNKDLLEGLYKGAIDKFDDEKDLTEYRKLTEEEKIKIRNAIDNLSQLGTKVPTIGEFTESTNNTSLEDVKLDILNGTTIEELESNIDKITTEIKILYNEIQNLKQKLKIEQDNQAVQEELKSKELQLTKKREEVKPLTDKMLEYDLNINIIPILIDNRETYEQYHKYYRYNLDNYNSLGQLLNDSKNLVIIKTKYNFKTVTHV
jgi:hypothetical protein